MKKVLSNKVYDTSTARLVGSWDNGADEGEPGWVRESLYHKRTGEYFLYGQGGSMTRYARQTDDGWGPGESIVPLALDEADRWAGEHLPTDEYDEEFGVIMDPHRDSEDIVMTVHTTEAAWRRLARAAMRSERTKKEVITELLMTLPEA